MLPSIDDTTWPVVRIRYHEEISLEEITELAHRLSEIHRVRGPLVTLSDISALSLTKTTAVHRKRIAEAADKLGRARAFIAEAVVVRNPVVRALYVGYSWARKDQSYPSETFANEAEAMAWALDRIESHARLR